MRQLETDVAPSDEGNTLRKFLQFKKVSACNGQTCARNLHLPGAGTRSNNNRFGSDFLCLLSQTYPDRVFTRKLHRPFVHRHAHVLVHFFGVGTDQRRKLLVLAQ